MCARSACVASCSRVAMARQKTSVVTIAFILLCAASCTQNGGSVAQRQFCRGRQNCAASDQSPNQPYHSGGLVSFAMRPVVAAFLLAKDAAANVRRRKHILQSGANRKILFVAIVCNCVVL